jgi:2-C-methyl-D-erythritol 4-phosphate cytidylyltransferase
VSVAAIIVAAGPGTRLAAGMPKAFVPLAGRPLVAHALRALLAVPAIDEAIVVVPPGMEDDARCALTTGGALPLDVRVVPGGAERQDSVRRGLDAVERAELVAIHDAARPFVSRAVIEAAIDAARRGGAAIVAVPATDTVKLVDADGGIESTPPRTRTWLAQTPQIFRLELIRAAHAQAGDDASATDDAMLVERLGHRVEVVAGEPGNRKITTPDDLRWAEWYLQCSAAPH